MADINTITHFLMNARPLSETDSYVLFQQDEDIFLFDKDINSEIWRTDMYGNATCGLIGLSNDWVVIGGKELILWKNNKLSTIEDDDLQWINDMRQVGENKVEILTDPWKDDSAIWLFDVLSESKIKIRDFHDYKSKEYTENVKW